MFILENIHFTIAKKMRLVDIKMYFHPVILSHKSVVKNYYYVDSKIPTPSDPLLLIID